MSSVIFKQSPNVKAVLSEALQTGLNAMAEQLSADVAREYIKVDTGAMRTTLGVENVNTEDVELYTQTPYATRQYYLQTALPHSTQLPKAKGGMWYHRCYNDNKKTYEKILAKAVGNIIDNG